MFLRLIQAYAFLLPFEGVVREQLGSDTQLKPYRLLGLAVIVIGLVRMTHPRRSLRVDFYDKAYLVIVVWGLAIAGIWAVISGEGNISWALSDTSIIVFAILVYLVIKNEVRIPDYADRIALSYALGVLVSMVGYAALGGDLTGDRFSAFYDNPNRLGVAIVTSINILVARLVFSRRRTRLQILTSAALLLTFFVALFFTASRGALVGLAASVAGFMVVFLRRRSSAGGGAALSRAMLVLPVALIAGIALNVASEEYQEESIAIQRYQLGVSGAAGTRLDLWRSGWNVAEDHYFIGAGTAQYRYHHRRSILSLDNLSTPHIAERDLGLHSDYVNIFVSFGALSLVLYLWMLFRMYRRLIQRFAADPPQDSFLWAATLPMLLFVAVNSATHIMMGSPDYWFIMAFITVYASRSSR